MKKSYLVLSTALFIFGMFSISMVTLIYYLSVYIGKAYDLTWSIIVNETPGSQILWYGGIASFLISIIMFIYSIVKKKS